MGKQVFGKPPLYGLDLVVDVQDGLQRTESGRALLNPARAVIAAAGVSTPDGDLLLDGPEAEILRRLDHHFALLRPGIIATWSGSTLDLPLLDARASNLRLPVGLRVQPDRRRTLRLVDAEPQEPTLAVGAIDGGHRRPLLGAWHRQRHFDLQWLGTQRPAGSTQNSLIDACRNAQAARAVADQRWARARRHLERMPSPDVLTDAVWAPFEDFLDERGSEQGHSLDHDLDRYPRQEVPQEAIRRHPSAGAAIGV